jgi:hypothetical protein
VIAQDDFFVWISFVSAPVVANKQRSWFYPLFNLVHVVLGLKQYVIQYLYSFHSLLNLIVFGLNSKLFKSSAYCSSSRIGSKVCRSRWFEVTPWSGTWPLAPSRSPEHTITLSSNGMYCDSSRHMIARVLSFKSRSPARHVLQHTLCRSGWSLTVAWFPNSFFERKTVTWDGACLQTQLPTQWRHGRSVKSTTHHHFVQKMRMHRALFHPCHTLLWY